MHTVYIKYISLYISLFQIRKYSYIAYIITRSRQTDSEK